MTHLLIKTFEPAKENQNIDEDLYLIDKLLTF